MLFLLATTSYAHASHNEGSTGNLIGVGALLVGILIMVFSGARSKQQAARLGQGDDSAMARGGQYLYIVMGAVLALFGVVMALGLYSPGIDGHPGHWNF